MAAGPVGGSSRPRMRTANKAYWTGESLPRARVHWDLFCTWTWGFERLCGFSVSGSRKQFSNFVGVVENPSLRHCKLLQSEDLRRHRLIEGSPHPRGAAHRPIERPASSGNNTNQTIAATHARASAIRAKNTVWWRTRAHHAATLLSRFDGNDSAMSNNPRTIRRGTTRTHT